MSVAETLLPEFDHEMAVTRRVLERVPDERARWKPHEKSFAMAHLAQLVSWMPAWVANALLETSLDLAEAPGYSFEPTAKLVEGFDANARAGHEAIANTKDADYATAWSLTRAGHVLFTAPRSVIVRQHISHLVHHRAQLGLYLRLVDVPVPSMYGPTADERTF